MNVSSTYLSHIDGFSDVDPNVISPVKRTLELCTIFFMCACVNVRVFL